MSKKREGDSGSYEVGYGKPPVGTRWQRGQSGNPKGRKKGAKGLLTIAREILNEKIVIKENGKSRKVTYTEGLVRSTSRKAVNGEKQSVNLMYGLIDKVDAAEQQRTAQRKQLNLRIIDETMTAKEAADAYAETVTEIKGISDSNFDWEVE